MFGFQRLLLIITLLLSQPVVSVFAQVKASLVSSVSAVSPGAIVELALRLEHDSGWHTYWINPGTGLPTELKWTLPEGVQVGALRWPTPIVMHDSTGAISGHGYEGDLLVPLQLTVPNTVQPGQRLRLVADASWLMCKETCVPGETRLELDLPIEAVTRVDETWRPRIASATAEVPVKRAEYGIKAYAERGFVILDVARTDGAPLEPEAKVLHFFPLDEAIDFEKPQELVRLQEGGLRFKLPVAEGTMNPAASAHLRGVLRNGAGWLAIGGAKGLFVDVPVAATPAPSLSSGQAQGVVAGGVNGIWGTLGLALVGGLILNLMPCVFPVLGIKILGFVQQAGAERSKVVMHGLVFSLGVLLSFWVLALGLVLLRSGGAQLGWGFQLQSAPFVFILAVIMLVFGLNMSGLFEFGLSATAIGSDLQMKQGYSGSFFTGVLATLVATPCSAPFLAPALGAALALPVGQSFLVFTAIAVGLSLPYLTLSAYPSLVKLLPRPGAWMETFKGLMAFPLYGTVAYLVWVLAGQVEEGAFLNQLLGLVVITFAVWDYGRFVQVARKPLARRLGMLRVGAALSLGLWLGWPAVEAKAEETLSWEPWSAQRVEQLRKEGRVIYVDFTARWCATCQANKKLVFGSAEVVREMRARQVALLRADWTKSDPLITAELARWGRSAVPFNLVYRPGQAEPEALPEVLTPSVVLKAISQ